MMIQKTKEHSYHGRLQALKEGISKETHCTAEWWLYIFNKTEQSSSQSLLPLFHFVVFFFFTANLRNWKWGRQGKGRRQENLIFALTKPVRDYGIFLSGREVNYFGKKNRQVHKRENGGKNKTEINATRVINNLVIHLIFFLIWVCHAGQNPAEAQEYTVI